MLNGQGFNILGWFILGCPGLITVPLYISIQRFVGAALRFIVLVGGEAASPLLPSSDLSLNLTCHVFLHIKGGVCFVFWKLLTVPLHLVWDL